MMLNICRAAFERAGRGEEREEERRREERRGERTREQRRAEESKGEERRGEENWGWDRKGEETPAHGTYRADPARQRPVPIRVFRVKVDP